ncbi:TPA: hypothetical protein ACH9NF_003872 [Escherichia coli]|nr:hypothetical protein [Escherichia coli]HDJ0339451.1 hypothetical protein [Escherichia coli]
MKSIVHLSDLHLSDSKKYGFHWKKAKELVTVLVNDIHSLSKENNLQIDAIFLLGI